MKTPNKKLDEKLRKQDLPEDPNDKKAGTPKKKDSSGQPRQHPKRVGFHGTDDERTLNPEE